MAFCVQNAKCSFISTCGEFSTFCLLLSLQNEAVDVDIDEILDMDTDDIRRSHLFVSVGGNL